MKLFPQLPDETNTWFYCADRSLTSSEQRTVLESIHEFVNSWESHGAKVIGDAAILMDRMIVIAGIIPNGDVSGCGIDASTQRLKHLSESVGFAFSTPLEVLFRTGEGSLNNQSRQLFRQGLQNPETNSRDIVIFDVSVRTLADVRAGRFEVPVRESWFARYMSLDPA